MGGVTSPELVAAVAGAGAVGMVPAQMLPADALAGLLDDLAGRTDGVVGVTFLLPFGADPACVEVAAARARLVDCFYGDPDPDLVARVHEGGALASWQAGSAAEAAAAADAGCDLVAVQGIEGGGRIRGRVALLPLLAEVLDAVEVPVVAAGGIATPPGGAACLAAGAAALPLPRFGVPCPNRDTTGEIAAMAHYAGQSVGATAEILPAAQVVTDLA